VKFARAKRIACLTALVLAAAIALPAATRNGRATTTTGPAAVRVSTVRSGSIPTHDALQLTLTADTGSVRIFTDASGEVRYRVRVEAEGNSPAAVALLKQFSLQARGTASGVALDGRMRNAGDSERVFVSYEIHLPKRYNLVVSTRAGDIITQDIDGQATLTTGGGNIQAGRVGEAQKGIGVARNVGGGARGMQARLETGGGHILVGDIFGGLRATTAGGHITAGNVAGDAVLHTDGGHIQVGRVDGNAQLTSGGGNITVARADSGVVAETTGGRIEFGEAAGAIHARSGGGGVRIAHVAGPTVLDSGDGGIFLADVAAPLHASTATGAITAWLSPQFGGGTLTSGERAVSELTSGQGDIVVYLPREIAVTIDAQIGQGSDGRSDHRIVADPSLPIKVSYQQDAAGHALRAQAALNGGGRVLHLKAGAGDIQLRYLDADIERQLEAQQMAMAAQGVAAQRALLLEMQRQAAAIFGDASASDVPQGAAEVRAESAVAPAEEASSGLTGFARLFEGLWWGGVRVDPDDQQRRLQHAVRPAYPEAARQAGLQGDVTLRLEIGADGAVKDVRAIAGDPELARAAIEAVSQWQYAPALLDGRPVSVVTTVTLAFRLQ
jgi:TonB family protein